MPKTPLRKDSHALGYNDRDNPKDLRTSAGQALVNMFPGSPAPIPRQGIANLSPPEPGYFDFEAYAHIVFRSVSDSTTDWQIFLNADGTWTQYSYGGGSDTITILGEFPDPTAEGFKLEWTQIRDRIYISTNVSASPLWILELGSGDTFLLRRGWMTQSFIFGGNFSPGLISDDALIAVSATLVRRTDAAAFDGSGNALLMQPDDPTNFLFNPGILESVAPLSERTVFTYDNYDWQLDLEITGMTPDTIDPQATHIRLYRSDEAATLDEAMGLSQRWAGDLPIHGPNSVWDVGGGAFLYSENKPQAVIEGVTDVLKTVGYAAVPPYGTIMQYFGGRLWVGDPDYQQDLIGRWFYTESPQDPEYPTKWQSMFRLTEYYKDTSLENSDRSVGMSVSGGDIIFLMGLAVWFLRDGNPDFEPVVVSSAPGAIGPYASRDDGLYYLSEDGPNKVYQRFGNPLPLFASKTVWPKSYAGGRGYFFTPAVARRSFMFFFRETLWVVDPQGSEMIGMYMPADDQGSGPMKVIPAAEGMIPKFRPRPLGENCYYSSGADVTYVWEFLSLTENLDDATPYTMSAISKQYFANMFDPKVMADIFQVLFFATWTGAGALTLKVRGDGSRFEKQVTYADLTSDTTINQPADLSDALRQMVLIVFRESEVPISRYFELEWSRPNDTPFDFVHRGFEMLVKPVPAFVPEYVAPVATDTP